MKMHYIFAAMALYGIATGALAAALLAGIWAVFCHYTAMAYDIQNKNTPVIPRSTMAILEEQGSEWVSFEL